MNHKPAGGLYISVAAEPLPEFFGAGHPSTDPVLSCSPPLPSGRGVGGRGSLGKCSSITDTHSKLPSSICYNALQKFEQLPYNDSRMDYHDLCTEFYEYLWLCEQKGFLKVGFDTRPHGKIIRVPFDFENRWAPGRRKELSDKLDRLEYWFELQQDRPITMITLTSYQQGETIESAWVRLNDSRTKLLKLIRKYFGDVDYFWVPEPHESGYVHYHLAVFAKIDNNTKDKSGKGIEDKFRDLWSRKYKTGSHTYGLEFSQKTGDQKIKGLKDYLSKYLRKSFLIGDWSIGMLLYNAHLWKTGFRAYGASKRISEILHIEKEKSKDIVWLETHYENVILDEEKRTEAPAIIVTHTNDKGEQVPNIIWRREYIPGWLDTDLWIQDQQTNVLRLYDPPPCYIHERWGRGPWSDDRLGVKDTYYRGTDPTGGLVTSAITGCVTYAPTSR